MADIGRLCQNLETLAALDTVENVEANGPRGESPEEWSDFYFVAPLRKAADLTIKGWQELRRGRYSRDIRNHPVSGDKKVQIRRRLAKDLRIDLDMMEAKRHTFSPPSTTFPLRDWLPRVLRIPSVSGNHD